MKYFKKQTNTMNLKFLFQGLLGFYYMTPETILSIFMSDH